MMGPVAAARPIFRPGSTFLLKQLSGPAGISRSRPLSSSSFSSSQLAPRLSSPTLLCRVQTQWRLYSTDPPKTIHLQPPAAAREPDADPKRDTDDTLAAKPSSSSSSSEAEPSSQAEPPSETITPSPAESPSSSTSTSVPKEEAPVDSPPSPEATATSTASSSEGAESTYELPSQTDSRRSALSHSFSTFMDNLQSRAFVASQTLNDLTGYSAIESIKASNARLEADLAAAQDALRHARAHYKAVNAQRAATQRETTTLLARKDMWSPPDLERFTTLYRQDHELEAAVAEAGAALTEAEADHTRLSQALNSGILRRYHEEQIWSDRIRRQSTWGTWGLMGVNVILFLILQFVAEPWKRNRLMKGIAAEEKAALEAVRQELEEVRSALVKREDEASAAAAATAALATPTPIFTETAVAEAVPGAITSDADVGDVEVQAQTQEAIIQNTGAEAVPVTSLTDETEHLPPAVDAVAAEAEAEPSYPPHHLHRHPTVIWWKEFLADPSRWRPAVEDLYSERWIHLRMRDASIIALEGLVTGAVIAISIAFMSIRRT